MRFPTLMFGFYTSVTWQDWQFGPGAYLGSDILELSLYLGPFSFNWQFEIEFPVKRVDLKINSSVHFDDFRGTPKWDSSKGQVMYDPFTKKRVRK